jgi:hypothetical protein
MTELKTDARLLRALRDAASKKVSGDDLREQRVSYVMGLLNADSTVTRDRVRDVLAEQAGSR